MYGYVYMHVFYCFQRVDIKDVLGFQKVEKIVHDNDEFIMI
jgi:hypothetical protein